jgi:hypothetical protein
MKKNNNNYLLVAIMLFVLVVVAVRFFSFKEGADSCPTDYVLSQNGTYSKCCPTGNVLNDNGTNCCPTGNVLITNGNFNRCCPSNKPYLTTDGTKCCVSKTKCGKKDYPVYSTVPKGTQDPTISTPTTSTPTTSTPTTSTPTTSTPTTTTPTTSTPTTTTPTNSTPNTLGILGSLPATSADVICYGDYKISHIDEIEKCCPSDHKLAYCSKSNSYKCGRDSTADTICNNINSFTAKETTKPDYMIRTVKRESASDNLCPAPNASAYSIEKNDGTFEKKCCDNGYPNLQYCPGLFTGKDYYCSKNDFSCSYSLSNTRDAMTLKSR